MDALFCARNFCAGFGPVYFCPMFYPVLSILPAVKEALSVGRIVILEAPPGAGKSTILPLHLLDEPWLAGKKIVMLEPRRLASRAVAMRMADLHQEEIGMTVGYRIRFENRISRNTRLEVVTEGILTRIVQHDSALEDIGLVIFDEFHERSLHADLALALTLQVQRVLRPDLRILIMSATLDGDKMSVLLNAPVIRSEGRQFPVSIHYLSDPPEGPISAQVARAVRRAIREQQGDILAFLPGAGEIRRAAELLEEDHLPVVIYPLYGDLDFRKQQRAIVPDPEGRRKVVLATAIAETSLTIEGVSVVIDSGYSRVPRFDPRSGFTRLETIRVTRDSADQRAGRAGRLGPGVCYRLWTQGVHAALVPARTPEIADADLAPLVLDLAQWGVKDLDDLTWITSPPAGAVNQALELLHSLGAVEGMKITDRGREMLGLPTHPRIAHMLLEAKATGQAEDLALAIDVAALLEERDPMPKDAGADLSLRVDLLRKWRRGEWVGAERNVLERIEKLAAAWRRIFSVSADDRSAVDTEVGKWLIAAYPERIGRQVERNGERYKMVNGRTAKLPSHDPLHRERWLAIAHVDSGINEGRIFIAAPVHEQDLVPLAVEKQVVSWDEARGMVTAARERRLGNLTLESRPLPNVDEQHKNEVLCTLIRDQGLSLLRWGDEERTWQARVLSLRQWRPDDNWPNVSDDHLLATLEVWLVPFLHGLYKRTELQKLELQTILNTLVPWELSGVFNQLAPARLPVPSGSLIRLNYSPDGRPPVMEVRLQELFGLLETPCVNEGRTKVVIHLLSPGYKPVQVTQDLKSFWANTYPEVRKELRTRYPKHSWPEDPWTAKAVRGVAKKR